MPFALKTHKSAGIRVTWAVHRLISNGNRARDKRDWTFAATAYREALQKDRTLAHIWVQLGHMLRETGQSVEAADAYRAASELRPRWAEPFAYLGHMARLQGDLGEAVHFYALAARADPERDDALIDLAATLDTVGDGSARARLRETLDAEGADDRPARLLIDLSHLVDRWLDDIAPGEEERVELSLLAGTMRARFCCMTADRNEWVNVSPVLLTALRAWNNAPGADRVMEARLRLMAAEPIRFGAESLLIGLGAPERLGNYFLSIRAAQQSVGLRYVACLPDRAPPAEWLAEARRHAAGFLVAPETRGETLSGIDGDRLMVMSFGSGWPDEAATLTWPDGSDPVPMLHLGRWYGLDAACENARAGQGWHVPDAGGCWTRGEGGELELRLPEGVRAPRLYLRLRALPDRDCRYRLRVEGGKRIEGLAHAGLDKWIAVDVPPEGRLRLFLCGDRQEVVPMEAGHGLARCSASIGVAGFCLIEEDDEAARWSILEAIQRGEAPLAT